MDLLDVNLGNTASSEPNFDPWSMQQTPVQKPQVFFHIITVHCNTDEIYNSEIHNLSRKKYHAMGSILNNFLHYCF